LVHSIPDKDGQANLNNDSRTEKEIRLKRELAKKQWDEGVERVISGKRRPINKESAAYKAERDPNWDKPTRPIDPTEPLFVTANDGEEHTLWEVEQYDNDGCTWILRGGEVQDVLDGMDMDTEFGIQEGEDVHGPVSFLHFKDPQQINKIKEALKNGTARSRE